MATNFPTSADSFTNPSPSDDMATVSHSSQHTNINDAVEAIETALLDGAPLHIDDANERVGIGLTNPGVELEVAGTAKAADLVVSQTATVSGDMTVDTDTLHVDSTNDRVGIGTTSPSQTLQLGETSGGLEPAIDLVSDGGRIIRMKAADSGNYLTVGSATTHSFALQTDNVRRLTIDSSGNVGINDTSPSYKLDVNGDIRATGALKQGSSNIMQFVDCTVTAHQFTVTGSVNTSTTLPSVVPTNARYIYGAVFITSQANDHFNVELSASATNNQQNWANNSNDPAGDFGTLTRRSQYYTHPGQNDNYTDYFGHWHDNVMQPVNGRTLYIGTYGTSSTTVIAVYIKIMGYSV